MLDRIRFPFFVVGLLLFLQLLLSWIGVAPFPFEDFFEKQAFVSIGYVLFYVALLQLASGIDSPKKNLIIWCVGFLVGFGGVYLAEVNSLAKFQSGARIYTALGGIGIVSLFSLLFCWKSASDELRHKLVALAVFFIFLLMMSPLPHAALGITSLLHPAVQDSIVFHFDQAFGFQPSVVLGQWASNFPVFKDGLSLIYGILPLGFAVIFGLFVRYPESRRIDLLSFWILSGLFVYFIYHIVPTAGPAYLFGDRFPGNVPSPDSVPNVAVIIPPAARNGIPSMHFGWALSMWLMSFFIPVRWVRFGFFIFLSGTILATLGLGEHYLIDLIIAVPYIVALFTYCRTDLTWVEKKSTVIIGSGLLLFWLGFVRIGVDWAQHYPWLVLCCELVTLLICVAIFRKSMAPRWQAEVPIFSDWKNIFSVFENVTVLKKDNWAIVGVFVFSGFAGLVYEVVFSKALALIFGSSSLANYTVLATYMGGMAAGAWFGGMVAARTRSPLMAYAFCELLIGVYAVFTPQIFSGVQGLYVDLAAGLSPDAQVLTTLRFSLGALALLLPTVLMGATMPIMARHLEAKNETLGQAVALLYGANTIGAAVGALLAGYWIIPMIGVLHTTYLAAALNLLVSLFGIQLSKRFVKDIPKISKIELSPAQGSAGRANLSLVLLSLGGIVSLSLEVVYVHLLAVVAGNSVYAFSLMLGTFLIGLGLGAVAIRRLFRFSIDEVLLIVFLECMLALVILLGVFFWEYIPAYFADFANYQKAKSFSGREFVRGVVCALIMLPPAFFIGTIYPLAIELIGKGAKKSRSIVLGRAMALNTLGNIAGVLLAGFVLIPALGALVTIQLIAGVCLFLACLAAFMLRARRVWALTMICFVVAVFFVQPKSFDLNALAAGTSVYFAPQNFGHVIDYAESVDGGLTTVSDSGHLENGSVIKTLLTNGKFQGNNSFGGEMQAQIGFALAPLLHTPRRDRALVIGYGTGATSRVFHEADFSILDIVELSRDIITMSNRHFHTVNQGVSSVEGVNTYITDGRNFLLLQPREYDVISIEITSIWFAGAASLYNKEFYELARRRLAPGGVLQQWVQLHHLRGEDFISILATIHSEFRYVWLYQIGGQGIIIATNDARAFRSKEALSKLLTTSGLKNVLEIYDGDPAELKNRELLNPDQMDRLIREAGIPERLLISTDNNSRLEYDTPKGNVLDVGESRAQILGFLKRFVSGESAR